MKIWIMTFCCNLFKEAMISIHVLTMEIEKLYTCFNDIMVTSSLSVGC